MKVIIYIASKNKQKKERSKKKREEKGEIHER